MVIMSPGVFPDTAVPDRCWCDDVWADSGVSKFVRGVATVTDPLRSVRTISGLGSSPRITNNLNNNGAIS